jgi:hypothetical protein
MQQQISYILENVQYMNKDTKIVLLSIIMNYIENEDDPEIAEKDILNISTNGTHINLDKLDQRTIQYIYDVVYRRITVLNTPYKITNLGIIFPTS